MKILFLIGILVIITPNMAFADYFQFFEGSRPYYIPYARVKRDSKIIGYTDAYGRLKIDLPPGEYQVKIEHPGGLKTGRLFVNGKSNLKRVEVF